MEKPETRRRGYLFSLVNYFWVLGERAKLGTQSKSLVYTFSLETRLPFSLRQKQKEIRFWECYKYLYLKLNLNLEAQTVNVLYMNKVKSKLASLV
jgi:hypothetical protein